MIAYIGNKRALLPFLHSVFRRLHQERPIKTFLDPFAGSGAVARLAKWIGFAVHANDWEYYAYILNQAFVTVDQHELDELFRADGGPAAVIGELNLLQGVPPVSYISRHYAPQCTGTADYRSERLFYTRENAEFIDRVRCEIERRYPEDNGDPRRCRRRALLLAPLLYQAATHANTSGVFKAYHKGFGGHGADALGRILTPMQLLVPQLIDGRGACSASIADAAECRGSYDLVYLDPPYNQHQYGSNYFMLNTIARWDRPSVNRERNADGSLRIKAGIRPDWVRTRSAYCSRAYAPAEFERLLDALDAPRLVLSYNAQGIIALEQLVDICSRHGQVEIDATDYVRYRGGRQSLTRRNGNHEFVLIVRRDERPGGLRADITGFLTRRDIAELRGRAFAPARLRAVATPAGAAETAGSSGPGRTACRSLCFSACGRLIPLRFDSLYRLTEDGMTQLENHDNRTLDALLKQLRTAVCADHAEEAALLLELLSDRRLSARERRPGIKRLVLCLRKLAHRKYRTRFEALCRGSRRSAHAAPELFPGLLDEIDALEALAHRRFGG